MDPILKELSPTLDIIFTSSSCFFLSSLSSLHEHCPLETCGPRWFPLSLSTASGAPPLPWLLLTFPASSPSPLPTSQCSPTPHLLPAVTGLKWVPSDQKRVLQDLIPFGGSRGHSISLTFPFSGSCQFLVRGIFPIFKASNTASSNL